MQKQGNTFRVFTGGLNGGLKEGTTGKPVEGHRNLEITPRNRRLSGESRTAPKLNQITRFLISFHTRSTQQHDRSDNDHKQMIKHRFRRKPPWNPVKSSKAPAKNKINQKLDQTERLTWQNEARDT